MNEPAIVSAFIEAGGLKTMSSDKPDDLFITCASFESRSSTLAECMLGAYRAKRSVLYVNSEFAELGNTPTIIEKISLKLRAISVVFTGPTMGKWEDAVEQFKTLREALVPDGKNSASANITLDITTFNREALLAALTILRWGYPHATIRIAYVSTIDYNPVGRSAYLRAIDANPAELPRITQYLWLSRGFRKMRNAIGFPGIQKPQNPSLLILIMGYEVERALTIVENLEPSKILLGSSNSLTEDVFNRRHKDSKRHMLQLIKGRQPVEEFAFDPLNFETTRQTLVELIKTHLKDFNIFISPMCTKPSLIASFLAAEDFPEVQITCSVPGEYNVDDYSDIAKDITLTNILPHES